MNNFTLFKMFPAQKKVGEGSFSVNAKGFARFYTPDKILETMDRVTLDYAGPHEICLSGMEPDGVDRNGRLKYKYQQWVLKYLEKESV